MTRRSAAAHPFDQGVEIDKRARFAFGVVAREGKDRAEHRAHRVDVADHLLPHLGVLADLGGAA